MVEKIVLTKADLKKICRYEYEPFWYLDEFRREDYEIKDKYLITFRDVAVAVWHFWNEGYYPKTKGWRIRLSWMNIINQLMDEGVIDYRDNFSYGPMGLWDEDQYIAISISNFDDIGSDFDYDDYRDDDDYDDTDENDDGQGNKNRPHSTEDCEDPRFIDDSCEDPEYEHSVKWTRNCYRYFAERSFKPLTKCHFAVGEMCDFMEFWDDAEKRGKADPIISELYKIFARRLRRCEYGYYEEKYGGEECKKLLASIRNYRKKILRLQHKIELRHFINDPRMKKPCKELQRLRNELEAVKQKYIDTGEIYFPTKAERNDEEFEKNIEAISKIEYMIGGYSQIPVLKYMDFKDNGQCEVGYKSFGDSGKVYSDSNEIRQRIREMHIGEWVGRSFFNHGALDGTQWEIKITFSNGHEPVEISGSNAYPCNFGDFNKLFSKFLD